jgi:hypothetical protein
MFFDGGGRSMTAEQKSSIFAAERWSDIEQELAAFEQRELIFLARERDQRLRELSTWLKVDIATLNSRDFAA